MELDPDQAKDFLEQLGLVVSLIVNSWTLWEKVKPFSHRPRVRRRYMKRHQ